MPVEEREPRFCPRDGTPMDWRPLPDEPGEVRPTCPVCNFIEFNNPRACVALLIEHDGRFMLLERAREPRRDAWDLPGGFVHADETPEVAAHRELWEETRLEAGELTLLGTFPDTYGTDGIPTLNLCYRAEALNWPPTLDETEAKDYQLCGPADWPDDLAFPVHQLPAIAAWITWTAQQKPPRWEAPQRPTGEEPWRARWAHELAGRAAERFRSRKGTEWRFCLSLWAVVGLTIAAFMNDEADSWLARVPAGWQDLIFSVAILVAVGVGLFFTLCWTPWLRGAQERDNMTSYFWERETERLIGQSRPPGLLVKRWPDDGDWKTNPDLKLRQWVDQWDVPHVLQNIVTWLLLLLLIAISLARL